MFGYIFSNNPVVLNPKGRFRQELSDMKVSLCATLVYENYIMIHGINLLFTGHISLGRDYRIKLNHPKFVIRFKLYPQH